MKVEIVRASGKPRLDMSRALDNKELYPHITKINCISDAWLTSDKENVTEEFIRVCRAWHKRKGTKEVAIILLNRIRGGY